MELGRPEVEQDWEHSIIGEIHNKMKKHVCTFLVLSMVIGHFAGVRLCRIRGETYVRIELF